MAETPSIEGYSGFTPVARGGFGQVYRARQDRFDRVVAVKVLELTTVDDRAVARFERECRVLGGLSWHPNVVPVYDSGLDGAGRPWLAMEFVTGGSLGDRLQVEGALPWEEVLGIGVLMCGALGTAHAAGVLHRDIKPENLLVGPFAEVKLADFGIAAVEGAGATTTGHSSFTVAHVPPEVLRNERPDERSDLYQLGSTLHMLIAGAPPLATPDAPIAAQLTEILTAPVPRLVGVPDDFADLLQRTMAKDRDDRPSSALALGTELQEIQRAHGQAVTMLRLEAPAESGAVDPTAAAARGDSSPTVTPDRTGETIRLATPAAAPAADEAGGADEVGAVGVSSESETTVAPADGAPAEAEPEPAPERPSVEPRPVPGAPSPKRRSPWKPIVATLAVLVLLGGGVAAATVYARNAYFVAFDEQGQVTIFRGRPGGFLVFQPETVETTDLVVADLDAVGNEQVSAQTVVSSVAAAEAAVDVLCANLQEGATSARCGS